MLPQNRSFMGFAKQNPSPSAEAGLSTESSFAHRQIFVRSHRVTERRKDEMGPLIVNRKGMVELKSLENVHPAHQKQLLTYLRLVGMKLEYLRSFGEALLQDDIERIDCGA
jgi:GxxExxY protein